MSSVALSNALICDLVDATLGHERMCFQDAFLGYNQFFLYETIRLHTLFVRYKGYIVIELCHMAYNMLGRRTGSS